MAHDADLLVVDDEPVVLDAVRRLLGEEELTVETASDGKEALSKLSHRRYRLVLLDIMLPVISGMALLQVAREKQPRTPVVMVTGYATLENAMRSFRSGAFDFIPKPFDAPELLGVVRRGLQFFDSTSSLDPGARLRQLLRSRQREREQRVLYGLGHHSWVSLHADGSAEIGVGETFREAISSFRRMTLPAHEGEATTQGNCCAEITAADDVLYRVWAPLSGTVIATNAAIIGEPARVTAEPFGDGWLLRIRTSNLEEELPNLTPC